MDTGVLVGAVLPRDAKHAAAKGIVDRIAASEWQDVLVSDYVVAEALNYLRARTDLRGPVEDVLELVFGSDDLAPLVAEVLRVHGTRFAAAVHLFRTRFDQGLSLTDWTTLVLMEEIGIDRLATFDGGFRGLVGTVGLG